MDILVVDNLSPFTPDILDCLHRSDIGYIHRRFSDVCGNDLKNCDKIILSGRRKNDKEINAVNSVIIRQCYQSGKPILGICYGAEIIALTFGGSIWRMPMHVHGETPVLLLKSNPLTADKKSIMAYESHGYCVARLPANFQTFASSKYCKHEIFSIIHSKIFGTQFHPEKSGSDGLALLQNFANL